MKTELQESMCENYKRKKRKIISKSVSALSLSLSAWHFISLCLAKAVNSFFILFPYTQRLLKGVEVNKLLYLWTKMVFCVFVSFSHGKVTTGVGLKLKASCYTHRPIRRVAMQASIWCSSSCTNAFFKTVVLQTSICAVVMLCYLSIAGRKKR